jgi:hypothetical protein
MIVPLFLPPSLGRMPRFIYSAAAFRRSRGPLLSVTQFSYSIAVFRRSRDPLPPNASLVHRVCHTRFLSLKSDAHRIYAHDQVVIHTVRM